MESSHVTSETTQYEESPPLGKVRRCQGRSRPPSKPLDKNESLMTLRMQDEDDEDPVEVGDEFNRDSVGAIQREEELRGSLMPEEKFGVIPVIDVKSKVPHGAVETALVGGGRMALVFASDGKMTQERHSCVSRNTHEERRVSSSAVKERDWRENVFKRSDGTIMPRNPLTQEGRASSVQTKRGRDGGVGDRSRDGGSSLDVSVNVGERERDRGESVALARVKELERQLRMKEKVIASLQRENRALHEKLAEAECMLEEQWRGGVGVGGA